MKPPIFALFTVLLAGALAGCSPAPIYRLRAVTDAPTRWEYGLEYVRGADAGIEVEAAYEHTAYEGHVLDVIIANHADATVLVDPRDFYFVAVPCQAPEQAAPAADTVHALDPEEQVLEIEKAASRARAREDTGAAVALAALAVEVAAAVVTADEHDAEPYGTAWVAEPEPLPAPDPVLNDLDRWEQTTIRKTTLAPGFDMRGRVYFPVYDHAPRRQRRGDLVQCLSVHFPVGASDVPFLFQQRRIQP